MRSSGVEQTALLLTLVAACLSADASRNRVTVRKYRTNFRVDSWDDDRNDPYRVTFWKFGLKSIYTFDTSGNIRTLTARDTLYTFESEVAPRMLEDSNDDAEGDVGVGPRGISCTDCSATWNILCDIGMEDVCYLNDNPEDGFDEDAQDSLRRMCSGFGAACELSAFNACDGQCTGSFPETTPVPVATTTPSPTHGPTSAPTSEPASSATTGPTEDRSFQPSAASTPEPAQAPSLVPTSIPTNALIPPSTFQTTAAPAPGTTPVPTFEPSTVLTPEPVQALNIESTGSSTTDLIPVPSTGQVDACNPNPCENQGSCSIDLAGGHLCSCASHFGGMSCQTETSSLDAFYIELEFNGTWTGARQAVFQAAADRWAEVVTHVPCGGTTIFPAGRLLIRCTQDEIDGEGSTLGTAGPRSVWRECPTITAEGEMIFDIDDVDGMEEDGTLEGVILHEMGHVIGIGTLWGAGFGECTTCSTSGDPVWTCPATLSAYADIGGTGADIVEVDGATGTSCSHLDEDTFADELMTGFVDSMMYLSKMTAAILDDLDYVVDPSGVDEYTLPSDRGISIRAQESTPSACINDTAAATTIAVLDAEGSVVEEKAGVMMVF